MRKNIKKMFLLLVLVFGLTGCVKYNATMKINKDKSMDYTIIYAMESSLLNNQELLTEENKKALQSQGFNVDNYEENSMKGFKISKKIGNIDDVSSDKSVNYNLSDIASGKDTGKIFTVKKGLLKSTYTANFKFDSTGSGLNSTGNTTGANDSTGSNTGNNSLTDTSTESTLDNTASMDSLADYTKNMDLSFTVELPYKAKSNNATKSEDNNKKLVWNLASDNGSKGIEFSFEMYNMTFIYILIGLGSVLFIILGVGMVVTIKNSKNKKSSTVEEPTDNINSEVKENDGDINDGFFNDSEKDSTENIDQKAVVEETTEKVEPEANVSEEPNETSDNSSEVVEKTEELNSEPVEVTEKDSTENIDQKAVVEETTEKVEPEANVSDEPNKTSDTVDNSEDFFGFEFNTSDESNAEDAEKK